VGPGTLGFQIVEHLALSDEEDEIQHQKAKHERARQRRRRHRSSDSFAEFYILDIKF